MSRPESTPSCRKPSPKYFSGISPLIVSSGVPLACAFIVPVTALVAPGPDVTTVTPSPPLTRA